MIIKLMIGNLSTAEQDFGAGFPRSGFPFAGILLNEPDTWFEAQFKSRVAQVSKNQLPDALRRRLSVTDTSAAKTSGFLRPPAEVIQTWIRSEKFEGLILATNGSLVLPPQTFTVFSEGGNIVIESQATDPWPQVLIELTSSAEAAPTVVKFLFRPTGNSVQSEVLYTRALHSVNESGSCLLASEVTSDGQVVGISFGFQPFSNEQANANSNRAKIARKLKFIEDIFRLRLTLPENIIPTHVQYIDSIFRGITEGEFLSRGDGITVFLKASDVDISKPPFSEAGSFEHYLGTEQALLYPQALLDVGPYYLRLNRAVIANETNLHPLRDGKSLWVRFEVLDSQISYRYNRYTRPDTHKRIQRRLKHLYAQLLAEESEELADTLLQPLILDVPPNQAIKIAAGWLEYHNFPDRFSPQEPVLDESRGRWRVPIYIVFTSGKGAQVGELLIDLSTGSIIDEPSPELMHQEGLALGEEILRVV